LDQGVTSDTGGPANATRPGGEENVSDAPSGDDVEPEEPSLGEILSKEIDLKDIQPKGTDADLDEPVRPQSLLKELLSEIGLD
ncbi:MAG: hypothetical protein AAGG72_02525, partial [Pseudomonadota bacterium]